MDQSLFGRVKNAWNAFTNKTEFTNTVTGSSFSYRPDRKRLSHGAERSIVNTIYNRIAMDAAQLDIRHVRVDEKKQYKEDMDTRLEYCLTNTTNKDQTARAFRQDIYLTMLDEGAAVIVPVDTEGNPNDTQSYDVISMRVGKVVQWYADYVLVEVYNDRVGNRQQILLSKDVVAIIENPFYTVFNQPNSTAQRLIRKLSLLDAVDEESSAGKLDLIIQLPYATNSDQRRNQAELRRKQIEDQLRNSKYGVAYASSSEHIVQLNRSLENNLLKQIEYLTNMLYSQLGVTPEILNNTASIETMNNYMTRVIEPLCAAVTDAMSTKFLSRTARTQGQWIMYFNNPFKLIPVSQLPDFADKLTRNEIMTSNEFRQVIGMQPSDDPNADELRNKNISQSNAELEAEGMMPGGEQEPAEQGDPDVLDQISNLIDTYGSEGLLDMVHHFTGGGEE